jgi:hypothetical protein
MKNFTQAQIGKVNLQPVIIHTKLISFVCACMHACTSIHAVGRPLLVTASELNTTLLQCVHVCAGTFARTLLVIAS